MDGLSGQPPIQQDPRDYDILIPFHMWNKACLAIPEDAKVNSFGGWKFNVGDIEIDIWPGDLSYLLQRPKTTFAYHLGSDTRVRKY